MAIRMKDWALQSLPSRGVNVPLQGIEGMDDAARRAGQGLTTMGSGLAEMMKSQQYAEEVGAAARFTVRLEEATQAAQAELADGPVQDWQKSLQREAAPMVSEALQELPESMREQGRALAEAELQRAALRAGRDAGLSGLAEARAHWQNSVDEAVKEGDEQTALMRLEDGRGVFVPEEQCAALAGTVVGGCRASRWQQKLENDPMGTLIAWQTEPRTGDEKADTGVEQAMAVTRSRLKTELGRSWSDAVMVGEGPAAADVQQAVSAGLLPEQKEAWRVLSPSELAGWQRRMDEADASPADTASLRMEVAGLPVPLQQRRSLLQYLQRSETLPAAERRAVGSGLWNLYQAGQFGVAGDAVPQRRLARLQQEAQQRLASQKTEEVRRWLADMGRTETPWVCFETKSIS